MTIEHHWLDQGLHIRYLKRVSGAALIAAARDVGSDERFDDLRYIISDWSQCQEPEVSIEEVEQLAAYITAMAKSNSRINHLNIMREDFEHQAFINLYMFLTADIPWQVSAHRSVTEAESWLEDNLSVNIAIKVA